MSIRFRVFFFTRNSIKSNLYRKSIKGSPTQHIFKHKQDSKSKPKYFYYMFPNSRESSVFSKEGFDCPMDNLINLIGKECPRKRTRSEIVNIKELMYEYKGRDNDKHRKKIKEIAEKYDNFCKRRTMFCAQKDSEQAKSKRMFFDECVQGVEGIKLKSVTIAAIFNECYGSNQAKSHSSASHVKKYMLDMVYAAHSEMVKNCFKHGDELFNMSYYKNRFFTVD